MANGSANYTEELVMALVTTQLTIMSFPIFNVQIVPFSSNFENLFGADAKIPGSAKIAPFYMQFKRPNRSKPGGDISSDRAALGLHCTTGSLNFGLREKAKRKGSAKVPVHKLQHNVLYRMRARLLKRGIGDAAYVCSLFLSSKEYVAHTHLHGLLGWPFYWFNGPYSNRAVVIHGTATPSFSAIPWLEGHVSIPPHDTVASASHSYSFDPTGGEVCFHSPRLLDGERRTLPAWIANLAESIQFDRAPAIGRSDELLAELRDIVGLRAEPSGDRDREGLEEQPERDLDYIAEWMAFGDQLEEHFGISQFAFILEA
ncbi:hypothetical protein I5U29_05855 [Stenotrophomonas maltophilia]|uniref:Uncharacterized protein n=1 Tax=Stenotrophomonas pavanii TaxID=487698 RepID=A0ABN6GN60_9GAMM|nr:hypothetical protein [Stenotrophomonas pavanii]MBH1388270.1 hypothetical protein [Stenotrophomonas maltophilia]UGB19512.1 hypothetical protein LQ332_10105 [Stenotrophomonas maltophilia]UGB50433.1 hypothetical protein LQ330_05005 [Stenotrophomonas maltophilia]BCX42188.1 hypothetical protein STNY_R03360 [Stenotrophomonas pavanii]